MDMPDSFSSFVASGLPPPPVGIDSFRILRTGGYYYVDKTLLIRDVLTTGSRTFLFTRPRRFGKSLALSMLKSFFEKADSDTSILFQGTDIEKAGAQYMDHQGRYPVIFLSFKDAAGDSSQSILDGIRVVLEAEYERHLKEMNAISELPSHDLERMRHFVSRQASESELACAMNALSVYLHDFHGVAPVILIDEYDLPMRRAWALRHRDPHCYDRVSSFMRRLLSATLMGNESLSYACLTGIERIARDSGESGLNNLMVFDVLNPMFSGYFGFTHAEVRAMLDTYGMPDRYGDICDWYQGYRFGDVAEGMYVEMFNPVSLMQCVFMGGRTRAYWAETSMNDTLGDTLDYATPDVIADLSRLLLPGGSVQARVENALSYPDLRSHPAAIFTLLLSTGYVTPAKEQEVSADTGVDEEKLTLEIPNAELRRVYRKKIDDRISKTASRRLQAVYVQLRDSVAAGDADGMKKAIREVLLLVLGPNDIGGNRKEDACHMLLTGLLGPLMGSCILASNGNAGIGRFDIVLTPLNLSNAAVVIEVKAVSDKSGQALRDVAQVALDQIDTREFLSNPYWVRGGRIFKYGVAFSRKNVEVVFQEAPRPW